MGILIEMPVHELFPEPVYFSRLERVLTKKELGTINKYKEKAYKNHGNLTSLDKYVLDVCIRFYDRN